MNRRRALLFVSYLLTLLLCSCSVKQTSPPAAIEEEAPAAPFPASAAQSTSQPIDKAQVPIHLETSIPVLMYHSISYEKGNKLCLKPSEFEDQIKTLLNKGYSTITADELWSAWQTGALLPPKPLIITLDDGYSDNYTNAFPILQKYKAKATIFIITGKVGRPSYMNWNQIGEMEHSGLIDIQSHSVHHLDMRTLSPEQIKNELNGSKLTLESKLNKPIRIFCYPSGKLSPAVLQALNESGYKMAFTTRTGYANYSQGLLLLHRFRVMSGQPFPPIDS